jgi:hypothetical protein
MIDDEGPRGAKMGPIPPGSSWSGSERVLQRFAETRKPVSPMH